jgi:hypothetical protein
MGYYLKAILGLAIFLGSIVLFNVELVKLLETGTCASGNQPFEIARPCPEGTATAALLLTGSVFSGLLGAALFAFRGDPPGGRKRRGGGFGFGTFAWGLFFTVTGAVALYTAFTSEVIGPDGELGGAIVGGTFLLMGLPALVYVAWAAISDMRDDESPAAGGAGGAVSTGGFTSEALTNFARGQRQMIGGGAPASGGRGGGIEELERLQRLRESGALTDEEFERQKAHILANM